MLPILYESGPISIQTIWVSVVIGLLVSSYLAVKRLKRRRVNLNLFIEHSGSFLLSALILSRITFFVSNPTTYFPGFDLRTLWNFVSIWDQGFSFWGAVAGFSLALIYVLIKAKEEVWKWFDALSIPLLVGMLFGYVGAFLGGYSYGSPTNLPWGIKYEVVNVKYTVPIHPTQVYAIMLIGLILWGKWKLREKTDFFKTPGNTSIYIVSTFSLGAFLLEFLKGDDTLIVLGIRLPQILFGVIFVASTIALVKRIKNFKKEHGSN